jgi:hypothetical protein
VNRDVTMRWIDGAPCAGNLDLFFSGPAETISGHRKRVQAAQAICRTCPFKVRCLNEALERGERAGLWGGVELDARHGGDRRLSPIEHGTTSGYGKHIRQHTKPCDECAEAWREYKRGREELKRPEWGLIAGLREVARREALQLRDPVQVQIHTAGRRGRDAGR